MFGRYPAPLVAAQLAVLGAVGLQLSAAFFQPAPAPEPDLDVAVPATLAGWTVKTEPLGPTPKAMQRVERKLNFDRAIRRTYSRGDEQFTVFAAYWNRGRMPARAVSIHTPDCCWSNAGYVCTAMKFRQTLPIPGAQLYPAEWRIFRSPRGKMLHTVFWQVVAGKPFDFGGKFNGAGDPWTDLKAFVTDALLGCREQLFVTVFTDEPIERLQSDPGFQTVLSKLAGAGLGKVSTGS